jgi:hypothetical protein
MVKVAGNPFDTFVKPILTYNSEISFMDSYLKLFRATLRAEKSNSEIDELNFIYKADIDLRQKCIHLRHNLFAPILLLRHLFVQTIGIICANKIDIHLRHCYTFIVLL